jgi:aspartyl-tRNA(Asn)/glutamyl-tRNA(Gln) amidotransferase subunit B
LKQQFVQELLLPTQDAEVLTEDKSISDYFLELLKAGAPAKPAANWMNGPVKSWMNEMQKDITDFPIKATQLVAIIDIVQEGKVNFSTAATKLLPALFDTPSTNVGELAATLGLLQQSDAGELETWVMEVLQKMPDKVKEYQKGKKGLIGLFVGEVKKLSKGKADPQVVTKILEEKLKEA